MNRKRRIEFHRLSAALIHHAVSYGREKHKRITVTIHKANDNSNGAFRAYCSKHGMELVSVGSLSLWDEADPLFQENEEIYELRLTEAE